MNNYNKTFFSLLVVMLIHGTLKADIIDVNVESTAFGSFWDLSNEFGLDPVNFESPQIAETYGSRDLGSAGSFDSVSDIDGDEILFKNGNASFGSQANSSSITVVKIKFQNTSDDPLRGLHSQILPAGMGFYLSDCTAENLRECESFDDTSFGLEDIQSYNGPGSSAMGAMFDFKVVAEGFADPLFSLTGSLSLNVGENGELNTIVQDFSEVEGFLTDFRQTSSLGNQQQITFDWGATDFDAIFPRALLPNEITTISYITQVSTFTSANCIESSSQVCPVAYAAFGDPIGRGGEAGPRTANAANFAMAAGTTINGYQAGLYSMAATFEDGILSYRANSGPGIGPAVVSAPASFAFIVLGVAGLTMNRKRYLK